MEVGDKLGKYELRGTLGRGAMGVVYDGWDPLIARRVAIKTVPLLREGADAEAEEGLARFRREAQAAGRLQHPNIVGIFDYGETGEFAYLVMEFVEGRTLKSALDQQERFGIADTVRLMDELLAALQYSHEHGVVHRDVKPANMMLTRDGHVKVADFGIARIESSSMTQVGTVLGTPAYMSPEQLSGQVVDARTDIYSAGVVLYQLLTGDRPYHGSNLTSIFHQALNTEPVPPSKLAVTVPPAFDPVIARAMAKRPAERYASAADFAAAIRAAAEAPAIAPAFDAAEPDATIIAAKPAVATPPPTRPAASPPRPAAPPTPPAVARPPSRLPVLAAAGMAVLVLAGAGGWYFTRPTAPAPGPIGPAPAPTPIVVPPAPVPAPEPVKPAPTPTPIAVPPAPVPAPEPVKPAPAPAPIAVQPEPAPVVVPPAPAPRPAPAPTTVALAPGALRAAIAVAIAPVGCAMVGGEVADPGGTVTLTGIAGRGAPEAALHRAITEAAPTAAVDWRVAGFDGPYCHALEVLHPVAPGFGSKGSGVAIALRSGNKALRDGDPINFDLAMPNYPAWLLLDYFQSDGTVVHLASTAKDLAHSYPAGSHQPLGAGAVGAPYGTDMIAAVASSAPLFTEARKQIEPADAYLRALQAALESAERRSVRVTADALVLTTKPKL